MLIMGHPQFETQDDAGTGHGIPPIPEWSSSAVLHEDPPDLVTFDVDEEVKNAFFRLRNIFQRAQRVPFTSTHLHDLTCFVVHRLLPSAREMANQTSPLTECVRYATILYMFIIQGPTYFTHAVIFNQLLSRFTGHLQQLEQQYASDSIRVWFLTVGMVASAGTPHYAWFMERARAAAITMRLSTWGDVSPLIRSILWLETPRSEGIFRPHWDAVFNGACHSEPPDLAVYVSPSIPRGAFI
jgi:multisubunit Na+/H+ antiporter MnhF subunit